MIRIVSTALLAATVFAAVPAAAQDLPTATVRYADLNLASPAGQAALDRRIASAVNAVCPAATGERDLAMLSAHAGCVATARKGAAQQVADVIDNATRIAAKSDGAIEIASR